MGFANIAQASGSASRAESELNLLTKENQNRMRVENSVSNARGSELDGRAGEAVESSRKFIDKFLQVKSSEAAKEAAKYAFWGSLVNLATKVGTELASQKFNIGNVIGTITRSIGDAFGVLGAWFALRGAQDEVKLLNSQFGILSKATEEDQNMVKALDGNPAI